jgi:4-hydroxythreonine-4-phosphate dehydrogenase
MESLYKIGITHGDINGIGYEVIIKALADTKMMEVCTPIVYGLAKVATFHRKAINLGDFSFQFIKDADQAINKKPNLINLQDAEVKIELGNSTAIAGNLAELSLRAATKDLKNNKINAIVTAPINKENIQSEKFKFSGHTEYFSNEFSSSNSLMMMVDDLLKVAFVSNHTPIKKVLAEITTQKIVDKLTILHQSLVQDFLCTNPTIAVLALNPHAGDNGLLGKEEKDIILPAIQQATDKKINAFGPFPADGFFASGRYKKFSAVLAMYHDQGMIPFKLLAGETGVNYTAGLPIVRTSPAHGTAYDIAGKNVAMAQSMRNAIYLAVDILRNRNNSKK